MFKLLHRVAHEKWETEHETMEELRDKLESVICGQCKDGLTHEGKLYASAYDLMCTPCGCEYEILENGEEYAYW